MAIVPFRVSGPAASQESEQRFLQIGPYSLLLKQRPQDSGNVDHLYDMQQTVGNATDLFQQPSQRTTPSTAAAAAGPDLSRVGLVLWQSGYVLADFLLLRLPHLQSGHCSSWAGMSVLELGCGAGTVGLFLALAGAKVRQQSAQETAPCRQLQQPPLVAMTALFDLTRGCIVFNDCLPCVLV